MPICHKVGARSRGCPITGIKFDILEIGYLYMETHVICTSITCSSIAFFSMFSTVLKLMKSDTDFFVQKKKVFKRYFQFRWVTHTISAFWKTHRCKLIPNWTWNCMITHTNNNYTPLGTIYYNTIIAVLQESTKLLFLWLICVIQGHRH